MFEKVKDIVKIPYIQFCAIIINTKSLENTEIESLWYRL